MAAILWRNLREEKKKNEVADAGLPLLLPLLSLLSYSFIEIAFAATSAHRNCQICQSFAFLTSKFVEIWIFKSKIEGLAKKSFNFAVLSSKFRFFRAKMSQY